jgi:signal peptidase II
MKNKIYTVAPGNDPTGKSLEWYVVALFVFLLDAASKAAVHNWMPYGQIIPFTDFFNLTHARNPGAAFSFLADAGGWQRHFFIVLACLISIWLAFELRKALPRLQAVAYSLILGGALGNAFDRGLRGYVVDYLDFHVGGWHWPAFNIADLGIVCGAALMVLATLRETPKLKKT